MLVGGKMGFFMRYVFLCMLFCASSLHSALFHKKVDTADTTFEWVVEDVSVFDELVVSWNALRPDVGEYALYVRVKGDEWSEDLLYAVWGSSYQRTFTSMAANQLVRTNEDTVELLKGSVATGFGIKIEAKNGAKLNKIWALHASTCNLSVFKETIARDAMWQAKESIKLAVPGRSQLALAHSRNMDLCSPTSTSAVVSFLSGTHIEATEFAKRVWDAGFDIYGNWIFNVAESAACLGRPWHAYMVRFDSFEQIYANLKKGVPTVVSVRGQLPGALLPYSKGHLIAVIGYDAEKDRILCMDPAYVSDQDTLVAYSKKDFLEVCARRGCIGYFFNRASCKI